KQYFLFTDNKEVHVADNVTVVEQEDMGWPFNTMKRFNMFRKIEPELEKYDYIFFINGNALFKQKLSEGFINREKNIITVLHPGVYGRPINDFPYERNPKSNACIAKGRGKYYVQGAFIGGKTRPFIEMIDCLDELTNEDLSKDIIAVWHDESFLNRYILDRTDVQVMGRQYLYYEEYVYPWKPVILLRDKTKYLNKNNGRFKGRVSLKSKVALIARNIKWKIMITLGMKREVFNLHGDEYIDKNLN
ncbi:MAG: hypothetical protein NC489_43530, partial [Ruminococcus flavefaciens]|nr:hypothetical protein [Ruminococcus flavefaciens]